MLFRRKKFESGCRIGISYDQRKGEAQMNTERRESVLLGVTGAFLGSLIGVVSIVILGQLGYVASFSGVIMAVCAVKGHELLGGRISKKGSVIVCILIFLMTYFGHKLNYAISAMRWLDVDIFTAYQGLEDIFDAGYLNTIAYWFNLVILYIFTLVGAAVSLRAAFSYSTPVSIGQETVDNFKQHQEESEAKVTLYPYAGLSWSKGFRFSLFIPFFITVVITISTTLLSVSGGGDDFMWLGMGIGGVMAMIVYIPLMAIGLMPAQGVQFVFIRTGGELWRVDLARLNLMEPYRFTKKIGAIRAIRWDILTEEEKNRAMNSMERAIYSIQSGEIMSDSLLHRLVICLQEPRLEKETKWYWNLTYTVNKSSGQRKRMMIGKQYLNFIPAPDATMAEEPLPVRWNFVISSLIIMVIGWGFGLSFFA